MKHKPIYKLVDGKGRVLIPKDLRTASGMDYGDIVRLGVEKSCVVFVQHSSFRNIHFGRTPSKVKPNKSNIQCYACESNSLH